MDVAIEANWKTGPRRKGRMETWRERGGGGEREGDRNGKEEGGEEREVERGRERQTDGQTERHRI